MKALSYTRSQVPVPTVCASGVDVVDISSDYSQYTVPRPVAEAVVHAAQSTDLGRTTAAGGRYLRGAIGAKLSGENELEVGEEGIVITGGGTAGMSLAFACLADAGEQILVPDPGWPGYPRLCRSWGIRDVPYPLLANGRIDYDVLDSLVEHDTKALVISHPNNVNGAVLDRAELQELVDFARLHDLYLISDESYDLIRFHDGPSIGPAQFDTDGRVISVFSFAKTHALAGLRLGYVVAAPPLAAAIDHTQEGQMTGASSLALAAGLAALEMDRSVVESMRQFYQQQRETLQVMLPPGLLPFSPEGGFHALLDISGTRLPDGDAFAQACLAEANLMVGSGREFGDRAAQSIRISLAVRERQFGQAMDRLLKFLESHRS